MSSEPLRSTADILDGGAPPSEVAPAKTGTGTQAPGAAAARPWSPDDDVAFRDVFRQSDAVLHDVGLTTEQRQARRQWVVSEASEVAPE